LQRTDQRSGVNLIAGPRQITASIVTANVVTEGRCCAVDVGACIAVQNCISNFYSVCGDAAVAIAADRAVLDNAAALETATAKWSKVVAESAVNERHRACDTASATERLTVMFALSTVAADRAAGNC
jgi:uncharacterized protein YfcZ (UPF0381/DUF406 family)